MTNPDHLPKTILRTDKFRIRQLNPHAGSARLLDLMLERPMTVYGDSRE